MTAKRILEIIEDEQRKAEAMSEKFAKEWMEAMDKHDKRKMDNLDAYMEIWINRGHALADLKVRIRYETKKEKENKQ